MEILLYHGATVCQIGAHVGPEDDNRQWTAGGFGRILCGMDGHEIRVAAAAGADRLDRLRADLPACTWLPVAGGADPLAALAAGEARFALGPDLPDDPAMDGVLLPDAPRAALVFRAGDPAGRLVRGLYVRSVTFAGAGCGRAGSCTMDAARALRRCQVCLHDALIDPALLDLVPAGAEVMDVGKRRGCHHAQQSEITAVLLDRARRGLRVVRLKGGDPGLFGRLAEETSALEALGLPYRVLPGVSALSAATTATGLLLTRRGVSRGFCAITPRTHEGGLAPVDAFARAAQPVVLFMAVGAVAGVAAELRADGLPGSTPAAMVFHAGAPEETVLQGTLEDVAGMCAAFLAARPAGAHLPPGVLIVGEVAGASLPRPAGALAGVAVRLEGGAAMLDALEDLVLDLGGRALRPPRPGGTPVPRFTDAPAVAGEAEVLALARNHVNAALSRLARLDRIVSKPWTPEQMEGVLDPACDLAALRAMDKPAVR
jgi:uroporphyrin-III C-methyltransferase